METVAQSGVGRGAGWATGKRMGGGTLGCRVTVRGRGVGVGRWLGNQMGASCCRPEGPLVPPMARVVRIPLPKGAGRGPLHGRCPWPPAAGTEAWGLPESSPKSIAPKTIARLTNKRASEQSSRDHPEGPQALWEFLSADTSHGQSWQTLIPGQFLDARAIQTAV